VTPTAANAPPWIVWAWREYLASVREVPGTRHNARVIYYHSFTRLHALTDEAAWCASFVCAALENGGVRSTRSARAADVIEWGVACGLVDGAVCYFPPSDPDAGGSGHVGFYWAGKLLGGNQRNRVGWDARDWTTATFARWPG
jgi:hypothetical protein